MAKKPLKVSSESLVYEKIPEGVYPIYESDWNRLKRMTSNIKPPRKWCSRIGSALLGVAGSSFIQLIYNYGTLEVGAKWNDYTMFIIFLFSLLGGIAFFVIDNERNNSISDAGADICREMISIEKNYRSPIEDASMHSEKHLSTTNETTDPKSYRTYVTFIKQ